VFDNEACKSAREDSMKTSRRSIATVAAVLVAVALSWPGQAGAQEYPFQVDVEGGYTVPLGATADTWKGGLSAGLSFTYWATPRVGLRVDGHRDAMSGKDAADLSGPFNAPNATILSTTGGVRVKAVDPAESNWILDVDMGAGIANFSSEDFPADVDQPSAAPEPDFEIVDLSETYVAVNGGVKAGYQFTEQVTGYVGGRATYIGSDDEDLEDFAAFDPESPEFPSPLWTIPVQAGVSISF